MKYSKVIVEELLKLKKIVEENDLSQNYVKQLDELVARAENFKVMVPLVGGFNAGKSSLINTFLGESILEVNIVPETAIATELHYGEVPQIKAHRKDGEVDVYEISELSNMSPKIYKYIELHLPNQKLRGLRNIVLVDMPGVDSSVEEHNQAIFNYIREDAYYVVLTDVNYGIKDSVLDFLEELQLYEIEFSVLLSKIDHKTPEEVVKVKSHVKHTVENFFETSVEVGTISSRNNEIEDFEAALRNINREEVLKRCVGKQITNVIDAIANELQMKISSVDVDSSEIDKKIENVNKALKEIDKDIAKEEKRIKKECSRNLVGEILSNVENVLSSNIDSLVQAMKMGEHRFQQKINALVRPTLIKSLDENIQYVFEESLNNLERDFDNIGQDLGLTMSKFNQGMEKISTTLGILTNPKFKMLVGGLALVTSVVAPWVELIIFFVPDILKVFVNQDNKIKDKIENEVIPEILYSIEPKIQDHLTQLQEEFISELRESFEEKTTELITMLEKEKTAKQNLFDDAETRKEALQELKDEIMQIKNVVQHERGVLV